MALVKGNARSASALDATILTGNLPAISGASLTGVSAGKVLQVQQAVKTDTFTTTSSMVDITGLSQSITMTSASNKVLVQVNLSMINGTTTGSISALKKITTPAITIINRPYFIEVK